MVLFESDRELLGVFNDYGYPGFGIAAVASRWFVVAVAVAVLVFG